MLPASERTLSDALVRWRQRGVIVQDVRNLGHLYDLALARGEFVKALGDHTNAWRGFVDACRQLRADSGANSLPSRITPQDSVLVSSWLRTHDLDVPWMREWGQRAAVLVRGYFDAGMADEITDVSVMDILGLPHGAPEPDHLELERTLSSIPDTFFRWTEPPPDPLSESYEAFIGRMKEAWSVRAEWLGDAPRRRKLPLHAEWFVRHRINGLSATDILSDEADPPDLSTVKKALKSFATLIEISLARDSQKTA